MRRGLAVLGAGGAYLATPALFGSDAAPVDAAQADACREALVEAEMRETALEAELERTTR